MLDSLSYFMPELALSAAVVVILLLDLVAGKRPSAPLFLALVAVTGLLAAGLSLTGHLGGPPRTIFFGMSAVDPLGTWFKAFFVCAGVLGVLFAAISSEIESHRLGEFVALLLCLTLGMFLLASASNLLMIYLALEFVSISSYILSGYRRNDRKSSEAALKYVIYGGVASGIMLYGLSLLFGLFGTLDLVELHARVIAAGGVRSSGLQLALIVGVIFSFAGFAYKIAAVPFHMWCPDVYEGAPTPFTAFLSVGPKAAGFAVLIRFFHVVFIGPGAGADPSSAVALVASSASAAPVNVPWPIIVGIVSMATMTLANLVALAQTNVKRLLAWSSVAHAGYILMGFVLANQDGVRSILLYLAIYLVMNLGAFLVVMAVRDGTGSEDISAYKGLGSRSPLLAIALAIFLFSLTGLPPLAGFVGKFYIFASVVHKGGWFFYLLAIVGVLNSVVSLYYYASIVRAMFLDAAPEGAGKLVVKPAYLALSVCLVIPTLVLGIYWRPLADLTAASVSIFSGAL